MPRAELLPDERRHGPARDAVVAPAEAQPDLASIAAEVHVRHAPPRSPDGDVDLVAGSPDVGHVLAVHRLDPLGVEGGGSEDARVRRLLRVTNVHRLLVALAAEVDHFPAQAGLVLDPLEEPQALRTGLVVAVPAPLRVLHRGRDVPQLAERALDALRPLLHVVEVGHERHDDELALGPLRDGLLRLGEPRVRDAPAALLPQLVDARDLRLGLDEEAVDEHEGGLLLERVDDDLGEGRVLPDLLRHLRREAGFRQLAHEIRDLPETEREQVRHVATPILSMRRRYVSAPQHCGDVSFPLIENGGLRPISWPQHAVFKLISFQCSTNKYSIKLVSCQYLVNLNLYNFSLNSAKTH